MKVVNCRDVGVDCDFVAKGETEDDVLRSVANTLALHTGMRISRLRWWTR